MKKRSNLFLLFMIIFLFLVLSELTLSLTIKDATIEELTLESDLIVRGKITLIGYEWEDHAVKKINTRIQLEVTEYLKGSGDSNIEIVQMGGKIDDIEDIIIGTPRMNLNDEVVLFLVKENYNYVIHSIALGCFKIVLNENKQKIAYNDLSQVNLVPLDSNKQIQPDNVIKKISLNDLYHDIQTALD